MTEMLTLEILRNPYVDAFARALLHFLWQGAAIGLVTLAALRLSTTARVRHTVGVASLGLMLAAPLATTWYLSRANAGTAALAASAPQARAAARTDSDPLASDWSTVPPSASNSALPTVALALWLGGVAILSIRLTGGWIVTRRLAARAVQPASAEIQSLARRVAGRLALARIVRIAESTSVAVPVMVGWMKPVVILPAAALSGLTPQQIEALVAHELAHVLRHDYLVNLLQSVAEVALFYHPAVWWVSSEVRAAREQSCDDLAVSVCDRFVYATALAELAAMTATPKLALAAADGSLVERVRRILGGAPAETGVRASAMPVALAAALLLAVVPAVWSARAKAADAQDAVATGVQGGAAGGVAEGVRGGVSGGVVGGAAGGISGGVQTAVAIQNGSASDRAPEPSAAVRPIERADSQQTDRGQETASQKEKQTVAKEGSEKLLMAQIAAAQQQLARTRAMVEAGLASIADVEQSQVLIERLELKLQAVRDGSEQAKGSEFQGADLKLQLEVAQKNFDQVRKQFEVGAAGQQDLDNAEIGRKRLELAWKAHEHASDAEEARLKTDLEQQKLETDAAKAKFDRAQRLFDTGVRGADQLANADFDLKRAQSAMSAKEKLLPGYRKGEALVIGPEATALRDRVLAGTLTDDALSTVFKDMGKLSSDDDRAGVLLVVAQRQTLTPDLVTQYVNAAKVIRADDLRARVFAQPIRLRPVSGK